MTNIILCGGNGTRLWPISRILMPKQFVKLFNDKSLFQLTVQRNSKICDSSLIVSNTKQYLLCIDQIEEIKQSNNRYLLESIGRNTAPAIALSCLALNPNELVLVTPCDHLIKDENEYKNILQIAKDLALQDNIVTFGITPTSAETGFGYIQIKNKYDVKAFHEKPDLKTANSYLKSGNYYWNSGMFMFKAGLFLEELKKYSLEIYNTSLKAFNNSTIEDNLIKMQYNDMLNIPSNSIDYALMENSSKVKVIPSNISWSDMGSFDALHKELKKDDNVNTIHKNHISINSKNNLILANNNKHISTIDVQDLIIVDTNDALLISQKSSSQKVKDVVKQLNENKSQLTNTGLVGYRPWGSYTILEDSIGYKVKKIVVKPYKRLSLQSHKYRNEHWIVIQGEATININDDEFILKQNESTYIKSNDKHRLSNETNKPLIIIEAQVGSYTGEDDIIRYEDDFHRNSKD